jgi:hypothetical protein
MNNVSGKLVSVIAARILLKLCFQPVALTARVHFKVFTEHAGQP